MKIPVMSTKATCLILVAFLEGAQSFNSCQLRNYANAKIFHLRMSYLDSLSPAQPDEENNNDNNKDGNQANQQQPPQPVYKPAGIVPSGRGPLGSYLDAVSSGRSGSFNEEGEDEDEEEFPETQTNTNTRKLESWTNTYLSTFLTGDDARTDIRNLLTQRSIQSFMRLLEECRDPHSAKWIQEDFLQSGNLLDYHGTGAGFIESFGGTWDAPLIEMIGRPRDRIIVSAKRRGRGHGGWSKNNPYLEERWMEMTVDIHPSSLASRILSVREQIAKEWTQDLDILLTANDQILQSFFDTMKSSQNGQGSFERTAANMMNNIARSAVRTSSPFRRSNFDLMYNLCTQAAIHRILRERLAAGEEREISFIFLRDFYTEKAEEYFDGDLQSGRADDFFDDLLQTSPSVLSTEDGKTGLVDPVGAAEAIIKMRKEVVNDWKALMKRVPEDHTGVRQALFTNQIERSDASPTYDNDSEGFQ